MEDVGTTGESGTDVEHFRLIGDVPYLLIEFRPEEDAVSVEISAFGISAEDSIAGIRSALDQIQAVLEKQEEQ